MRLLDQFRTIRRSEPAQIGPNVGSFCTSSSQREGCSTDILSLTNELATVFRFVRRPRQQPLQIDGAAAVGIGRAKIGLASL